MLVADEIKSGTCKIGSTQHLNKDHFETTRKGTRIIRLVQQKTKTEVIIPILKGNVIVPRYDCVSSHTARRTGITNMYLSQKYTILQMMHVSGHKTQKPFMDYIKLSSEEIADEIASMSKNEKDMW